MQESLLRIIKASSKLLGSNKLIIGEIVKSLHNCTWTELTVQTKTWQYIELPYKENKRNISRIPRGIYTWKKITRTNGNPAIWIENVPDRTEILIHKGSHPSHTQGCIISPDYHELHDKTAKKGLLILI